MKIQAVKMDKNDFSIKAKLIQAQYISHYTIVEQLGSNQGTLGSNWGLIRKQNNCCGLIKNHRGCNGS